jgi:hypothetical protein
VPPPPNDLCESVTPVSLPVNTTRTFTGTNAGALNDCSLLSYPQVWEAFTTTETLNITVDYCGTVGYTNYFVNLIVGCPCGSALGYYSYDFTTCVDSAITIKFHGVPPGTYYLPVLYSPVGSANPASGPYTIHVIGVTPPPPPPNLCATSLYSNGAATGFATASQCDNIYPFAAGTADDFILPGTGNVTIDTVIAYFGFWNGATDPSGITGMVVTIYADNAGYPAGQPIDGDPGCAHEALVPGGIITSEVIPSGSFSYGELTTGVFQMAVPITPVILTAGTTYWLEVAPILSFSGYGQCGWIYTDAITGIGAMQIFALLGATAYAPLDPAVDMAFCLKGPSAPSCVYLLGDVNSDDLVRGGDVTFAVRYFKGLGAVPPDSCHDAAVPTPSHWLYVSGDVNGDCKFMGSDVTRLVSYFKGISVLVNCPLFPHPLLKPASNDKIEISK